MNTWLCLNEATPANGMGSWLSIGLMVLLFVGMYFLLIRPQKKQEKQANEMRNNLEVGDEITTIGGIIGAVVSIKDETLVIETTRERTKIRILRSAVRSVDVKANQTEESK